MSKLSGDLAPVADAFGDALKPILTLEDRDDGWNDVRQAIRERQKPWAEFKETMSKRSKSITEAPAVRWARVLSDEAQALAKK